MRYLGLVVVGVSACASTEHVAVTPLPPSPSPDQRMWFYETYRPAGKLEEVITTCHRNGCYTTRHPMVSLGDGRLVRDPADLAPLVAPDSRTLVEAHRAHRAADRGRWWAVGAIVGLVTGMAIGIDGNSSGDAHEIEIGVGIALGSLLVGGVAGYLERDTVYDARKAAFAWYPHDLAEQLHVCWNGAAVVPCEAITPGGPPEKPLDPNLDQLRPR